MKKTYSEPRLHHLTQNKIQNESLKTCFMAAFLSDCALVSDVVLRKKDSKTMILLATVQLRNKELSNCSCPLMLFFYIHIFHILFKYFLVFVRIIISLSVARKKGLVRKKIYLHLLGTIFLHCLNYSPVWQ